MNLPNRQKFFIKFGGFLAILLVITVASLFSLSVYALASLGKIHKEFSEKISGEISATVNEIPRVYTHTAILHSLANQVLEAKSVDDVEKAVEQKDSHLESLQKSLATIGTTREILGTNSDFRSLWEKWSQEFDSFATVVKQRELLHQKIVMRENEFASLHRKMIESIDELRQRTRPMEEIITALSKSKSAYDKFADLVNSKASTSEREKLAIIKKQQKYQDEAYAALLDKGSILVAAGIEQQLAILRSLVGKKSNPEWALQTQKALDGIDKRIAGILEFARDSRVLPAYQRLKDHNDELRTILFNQENSLQKLTQDANTARQTTETFYQKLIGADKLGATSIGEILHKANAYIADNTSDIAVTFQATRGRYIAYLLVSLLASLFLGWTVTGFGRAGLRSQKQLDDVSTQITYLSKVTQSVAEGDLSVHFQGEKEALMGKLSSPLNLMITSLNQLVCKIRDTSTLLSTSTQQILGTISEQTSTADEQSKLVRSTAVAMEELVQTSTQIADNANRVAAISEETLQKVHESADGTRATMEKMNTIVDKHNYVIEQIMELGQEINKIHEVMDFIDEVADQTKMIGFNAALEAAGASQSGLRFSVVATEIRRLASNIMEHTAKIGTTITTIQESTNELIISSEDGTKQIQEGYQYAQKIADNMGVLLKGAEKTTASAQQINLATQQQSTAARQILESLKQIDSAAAFAAKTSEDTKQIFDGLRAISEELIAVVKKFKLSQDSQNR